MWLHLSFVLLSLSVLLSCSSQETAESCGEVQKACISAGRCLEARNTGSTSGSGSANETSGSVSGGDEATCSFRCVACGPTAGPSAAGGGDGFDPVGGNFASGGFGEPSGPGSPECPENSGLDPVSGGCECDTGFLPSGDGCKSISDAAFLIGAWQVTVVANAEPGSGLEWSTFQLVGNLIVQPSDIGFGHNGTSTVEIYDLSVDWTGIRVDGTPQQLVEVSESDNIFYSMIYERQTRVLRIPTSRCAGVTWADGLGVESNSCESLEAAGVVNDPSFVVMERNAAWGSGTVSLQK